MTENRVTPIRVGVVGVGRGRTFMRTAQVTGMELVAICDTWEDKLTHEGEQLDVSTYTDYEDISLTSSVARTGVTTNNKIDADLDTVALRVSYAF